MFVDGVFGGRRESVEWVIDYGAQQFSVVFFLLYCLVVL